MDKLVQPLEQLVWWLRTLSDEYGPLAPIGVVAVGVVIGFFVVDFADRVLLPAAWAAILARHERAVQRRRSKRVREQPPGDDWI